MVVVGRSGKKLDGAAELKARTIPEVVPSRGRTDRQDGDGYAHLLLTTYLILEHFHRLSNFPMSNMSNMA